MNEVRFNDLYEKLINGEEKLALVGLGYVGMPIAVEFAKHVKVIGFNHNERRIQQYKSGIDPTNEVGNEVLLWQCLRRLRMTTILILSRWRTPLVSLGATWCPERSLYTNRRFTPA